MVTKKTSLGFGVIEPALQIVAPANYKIFRRLRLHNTELTSPSPFIPWWLWYLRGEGLLSSEVGGE